MSANSETAAVHVDRASLHSFIWCGFLLGPAYLALFGALQAWSAFAVASIYTAVELLALLAFQAERDRFAAVALTAGLWMGPATVIFLSGGLASPLIVWLTPAIFVAGAVLRGHAATIVGVCSLVHIGALVLFSDSIAGWNGFPVQSLAHSLLSLVSVTTAIGALTFFGVLSSRFQQQVDAAQLELKASDEARLRAEASATLRSQLLANTSHEIRTPLNGILGSARLLLDETDAATKAEYAAAIHNSATHLRGIIDDLLDLSRADSGHMAFESIPFDAAKLVSDVVQLFLPSAKSKDITLVSECSAPHHWFRGDPNRIRQILANLVGNAVKFTTTGGVRIVTTAEIENKTATLRISVTDSGPGIQPDKHEDIFLEFVQADVSTTRQYGGTGLGLPIARRIARLMGGEVAVESENGAGAAFHVAIPLQLSKPPDAKPEQTGQPLGELSVLVVDDNPVNRMVAARMLKKLGATVATAEDGQQACDSVNTKAYDLILMDLQMPVKGGLDAAREIRARPDAAASIPIWALTASVFAEDKQHCIEAGMEGVLTKPIVVEDLQNLVRHIASEKTPVGHPPRNASIT